MTNSKGSLLSLVLLVLAAVIVLTLGGCGGDGGDGVPPDYGSAPKIEVVELYLWDGPYIPTFIFQIGDEVDFTVWAYDPDLDIKTLYITEYLLPDTTTPYYGPEPLPLPSQTDAYTSYWPLAPILVTGPAGDWRIDFQIDDARGNDSNIYTIYVLVN